MVGVARLRVFSEGEVYGTPRRGPTQRSVWMLGQPQGLRRRHVVQRSHRFREVGCGDPMGWGEPSGGGDAMGGSDPVGCAHRMGVGDRMGCGDPLGCGDPRKCWAAAVPWAT